MTQPASSAAAVIAPVTVADPNAGGNDAAAIKPIAGGPAGLNAAYAAPDVIDTSKPADNEIEAEELSRHDREHLSTFFSIYFMMTGLHGIHVLVGMGLMIWLLMRAMKNEFSSAYFTPVDLVGLYWHLVDLIWIFLFPLLYLIH